MDTSLNKTRPEVEEIYHRLISYMNICCELGMFDDPKDLLFARLTGDLEALAWVLGGDSHNFAKVFEQQLAIIAESLQKARELAHAG